jgi:hypothetical protein
MPPTPLYPFDVHRCARWKPPNPDKRLSRTELSHVLWAATAGL